MDPAQQQVRILLQGEIVKLVLGIIISGAGLSALAVQLIRWKSRARLLLWFGLSASLYGLRILAETRAIESLFDAPPDFCRYSIRFISDVIIIPFLLFFEELYGNGWKSSIRWLIWGFTIYGFSAILIASAQGRVYAVPDPGTGLILIPFVLIAGYWLGYRPPGAPEVRTLYAGILIFSLAVLNDHLVDARLLRSRDGIEPIGFLILVGCMGYIAVRRFFVNEQQLISLEEEMKSARRIQASILPQSTPCVDGLEVAARYSPMTAVAGDFYDFLSVDGKGHGFMVADVAGHGVPAALVAAMVKVAVSSQVSSASDPAKVIAGLNRVMCRQAQGQFITAGYLFVDGDTRTALYAAAGHPPLLLWRRANQTIHEFRENGLLLGVRANEEYSNMNLRLQSGDRLLLYSDGIVEASNPSEEQFGERRFQEFIKTHKDLEADGFAGALLKEVLAWPGTSAPLGQTDDITLLVIDVKA
jgi:sigma-B regulation protein RsbU (phosphoserine phosphatase)